MIQCLSEKIPKDWTLIIKEHPSVFMNDFKYKYRDEYFYHDFSHSKNIKFISLHEDPFALIDGCEAVATITGTVGIEALLRGKPVLVFGNAKYRGFHDVFEITNLVDIDSGLKRIKNISSDEIIKNTNKEILAIMKNSVSGFTMINRSSIDHIYDPICTRRGTIELIRTVLRLMEDAAPAL